MIEIPNRLTRREAMVLLDNGAKLFDLSARGDGRIDEAEVAHLVNSKVNLATHIVFLELLMEVLDDADHEFVKRHLDLSLRSLLTKIEIVRCTPALIPPDAEQGTAVVLDGVAGLPEEPFGHEIQVSYPLRALRGARSPLIPGPEPIRKHFDLVRMKSQSGSASVPVVMRQGDKLPMGEPIRIGGAVFPTMSNHLVISALMFRRLGR